MKIGIVGFGDFTRLIIKYLSPFADIVVLSRNTSQDKQDLDFEFAQAKEVFTCPFVIFSVPAQFLGEYLKNNAHHFVEPNVVLDVSSVKVQPIQDMYTHLPDYCQIIGTHPIFGPGSAADGLKGLEVVLTNVTANEDTFANVAHFLTGLQLKVVELSAQEHDKQIGYILGLTQYIGRLMNRLDIPNTDVSTPAYRYLMQMRDIQGTDSWELFESIVKLPESEVVIKSLKQEIELLDRELSVDTSFK